MAISLETSLKNGVWTPPRALSTRRFRTGHPQNLVEIIHRIATILDRVARFDRLPLPHGTESLPRSAAKWRKHTANNTRGGTSPFRNDDCWHRSLGEIVEGGLNALANYAHQKNGYRCHIPKVRAAGTKGLDDINQAED